MAGVSNFNCDAMYFDCADSMPAALPADVYSVVAEVSESK
jgi:hypothetical protein